MVRIAAYAPIAASLAGRFNCLDSWVLSPLDRKALLEESEIMAAPIEEQFQLVAPMSLHVTDP